MATMYELTGAYLALSSMLDEADSMDDIEYQAALESLIELDDAIECKAECYARIIKNIQSDIAGLEAEEKRLKAMRETKKNTVERLRKTMLESMKATGKDKMPTSIGKWSVSKAPMSVNIIDKSKVPERFLEYAEPEVNKTAILAEHKMTGEDFEGVEFVQNDKIMFK